MTHPIGIDFGGSGIKAAPVDLAKGDFTTDRQRIKTPAESTPEAVAAVMLELCSRFDEVDSPVGVTIPGVVRRGVVGSAANIHKSWIGVDADALLTEALSRDVHVVNDADAAGIAELKYGAAKGESGLVILTTLGTGIGSAFLYDGVLIPNTEFGHFEMHGKAAEKYAASSIKDKEGLTYPEWAERLTKYYSIVERLFSPDLFIIGGGVSKDHKEFLGLVKIKTPIVPAKLHNKAGIIGAAVITADLNS